MRGTGGLAPLILTSALLMMASGQLQAAAAVPWRKEPLVCIKYQVVGPRDNLDFS